MLESSSGNTAMEDSTTSSSSSSDSESADEHKFDTSGSGCDEMVTRIPGTNKIKSSNLPLIYANGNPYSLDTISQSGLERFVPFMIRASLKVNHYLNPKAMNKLAVPEWWPQGFPFKFPLVDQYQWINIADYPSKYFQEEVGQRHTMLKSLVCRCYMFYGCEFLLKFSSELSNYEQSKLVYKYNKQAKTYSIRKRKGQALVRCLDVNFHYDAIAVTRRYLSATSQRLMTSPSKRSVLLVDLTYDPSPGDEKEVNLKECPTPSTSKRSVPLVDLTYDRSPEDEKEVNLKERPTTSPPKRSVPLVVFPYGLSPEDEKEVYLKKCPKTSTSKRSVSLVDLTNDRSPEDEKEVNLKERPITSSSKRSVPFVDLTYDPSPEDEKEVYLRESPSESPKLKRRKISARCSSSGNNKQKRYTKARLFLGFPEEEKPETDEVSQEEFMEKMGMGTIGKETKPQEAQPKRKKRLRDAFTILSVSSERGQKLLQKNKHKFSVETSLKRIDKYTEDAKSINHMSTRRDSTFLSEISDYVGSTAKAAKFLEEDNNQWCHTFKWPRRNRNVHFHHRGPSIKPCSVVVWKLSLENITSSNQIPKSVGTNTPKDWKIDAPPLCCCKAIPLITLDDENSPEYTTESTSTRCPCNDKLPPPVYTIEDNEPIYQVENQREHQYRERKSVEDDESIYQVENQREHQYCERKSDDDDESIYQVENQREHQHRKTIPCLKPAILQPPVLRPPNSKPPILKPFPRSFCGSKPQGSDGLNEFRTGSFTNSCSGFMEGSDSYLYNVLQRQDYDWAECERAMTRRPLVAVPSVRKEICNLTMDQSVKVTTPIKSAPLIEVNFSRSIIDAIKWHTMDDIPIDTNDTYLMQDGRLVFYDDRSQENITPIPNITLPNSNKLFNYFKIDINDDDRDHCFERSSDDTSKVVTRHAGSHLVYREPCPACFQGIDNFCVYEYIRQAKVIGIPLRANANSLQHFFYRFIKKEKYKA